MPAIVTLQRNELSKKPQLLSEVRPLCNSITEGDQHLILEPKAGYFTPLTTTLSKQNLSYEVVYQETRFTQEQLSRVLTATA